MRRSAVMVLVVLLLGAEHSAAQSGALPSSIESGGEAQGEVCICNEDYTECLCCETVVTFPFVACDIVIEGEEVTGTASLYLTVDTADGTTKIRTKRLTVQQR